MIINIAQVKIEQKPVLTGLPKTAYVEYFGKFKGGRHFAIIRPRENWTYDDFVLLLEIDKGFIWCPAKEVVRYRDGGTTEILVTETEDTMRFHFPTPFKPELKPTCNGAEIEVYPRLPDQFETSKALL